MEGTLIGGLVLLFILGIMFKKIIKFVIILALLIVAVIVLYNSGVINIGG